MALPSAGRGLRPASNFGDHALGARPPLLGEGRERGVSRIPPPMSCLSPRTGSRHFTRTGTLRGRAAEWPRVARPGGGGQRARGR